MTSEIHQDMLKLDSEDSFHLILDQCGALQPLKQIRHFAVQSGMLCTTVKPADVSRPHFVVLAWISSLLTYTEADVSDPMPGILWMILDLSFRTKAS